ncbi:hypothetical protein LF887_24090 [Chryseobacterium sp. MEBOG06]|uniref:hypothetical protein n=1 Tax=Chryseobacterium sp. MEBOG06 TaxID=2879938 RepID=UPI001F407627|nr:hypothetical protein [Chryseobacterium sp. MEBOG06]UKB84040.1 hypothetical protein LF887_24090 [Chryseobacterium sp. MEBOG06]
MKKYYLLLPILFLASCSDSNDDNDSSNNNGNNNDNSPVLVTKMISDGEVSTYTYNGSKIAQINNSTNGEVTTFMYSGNLITQQITSGANTNYKTTYAYDGNSRLSKKIYTETSLSSGGTSTVETNYSYITGNSVKISYVASFSGSSSSRTGTKNAILNTDGSLSSWTETAAVPANTGGFHAATGTMKPIVYDTKNAPFKNVTGFLKIIDTEDENGSTHNIVSYNSILNYNNGAGSAEWTIFKSNYEYNASGYPTKNSRTYYNKAETNVTNSGLNIYEYNHL